jgi:hypothetical protein
MKRFRQQLPCYRSEGHNVEAEDILDQAGLGFDIPDERDSVRVVRYEGTISRTLKNALAQLKTRQTQRYAGRAGDNASAYEDRDVVVDANAMTINGGPEHKALGAKTSLFSHALDFPARAGSGSRGAGGRGAGSPSSRSLANIGKRQNEAKFPSKSGQPA